MTLRYAVGIKIGNRADQMTVEAEDALIAALKVKTAHPEAAITYVRKRNAPRRSTPSAFRARSMRIRPGKRQAMWARSPSSVLRALLFTSRPRARLDEYPAAGRGPSVGGVCSPEEVRAQPFRIAKFLLAVMTLGTFGRVRTPPLRITI